MRRIIKPFTVELRSGKRKPPSPLFPPSDQPAVDWPEALLAEFRADPEPSKPVGRVLPALDEVPEAMPMWATETDADADVAEPIVTAPVTEAEAEPVVPIAAEAPMTEPAMTEPAPGSPSSRLPRLSRDAFARGERWKARLPAAVHRTRRGFRTERGGSP